MQIERKLPTQRWTELNRRLRLAFLREAEERSRLEHGRGLTADELHRVVARYPGDIPDRHELDR